MPYIKKDLRQYFEPIIEQYIEQIIAGIDAEIISEKDVAGLITFAVFKLIRRFYQNAGWYDKMDAIKVCESAKTEFLRRFVYPYEDEKIKENGDVE